MEGEKNPTDARGREIFSVHPAIRTAAAHYRTVPQEQPTAGQSATKPPEKKA